MRTLTLLVLVGLIFCLLLPAQGNPDDDRIYDAVRRKLANDPDVKGGTFEVAVQQGVVTLRGEVEKPKFKDKASKLAKKVKGVKQVDNQLTVKTQ